MKTNETIILDAIAISPAGEIELFPTDNNSDVFNKINAKRNIAVNMYFELYKTDRLAGICEYYTEHVGTDNFKVIDFVIDRTKLNDEFIKEMNQKFPGNGLDECAEYCHCHFSNAIGLANRPFSSFRDFYGTVSRSFEHPFVMSFFPEDCYDFKNIASTKNTTDACIEIIKRMWNESETKPMSCEEYDQICDMQYT